MFTLKLFWNGKSIFESCSLNINGVMELLLRSKIRSYHPNFFIEAAHDPSDINEYFKHSQLSAFCP